MPAAAPPEPYWDPYDVDIDLDPYDAWRRLRDEVPVYRNERYDFWALSRFEDVAWASRQPDRFISGHGTVLEIMGPGLVRPGLIIFMDPPEHTAFRALVSRAFTPRRVAELENRIRQVCAELLDAQRGKAAFDYVADFGAQLPSLIISELLGVPGEDRMEVLGLIDQIFHIEPGVGMVNDTSLSASIRLHQFLALELEERRRRPRSDLLTALTEVEVDVDEGGPGGAGAEGDGRRRLSETEAVGFANLLVSAGTETVGKLLGWAAVVLGAHGSERRRLAQEPDLIPAAVEELLRYEAPSPVQARRCVQETELHGTVIPEGAKVVLLTGSAGRDERRYEDADRFRLDRTDAHLSFGVGVHFCLGAALARLEGRVALEETLRRFPDWEVDIDGVERMHTSTVRGHSRVPIRVD